MTKRHSSGITRKQRLTLQFTFSKPYNFCGKIRIDYSPLYIDGNFVIVDLILYVLIGIKISHIISGSIFL